MTRVEDDDKVSIKRFKKKLDEKGNDISKLNLHLIETDYKGNDERESLDKIEGQDFIISNSHSVTSGLVSGNSSMRKTNNKSQFHKK